MRYPRQDFTSTSFTTTVHFTAETKGSHRDVIRDAIHARLLDDAERVDDVLIDKVCGYLIKVSRNITRIEVNRCKAIAKYVSTLDLTGKCTGDVDKTYCGDCRHHDSRAQPYHSDSWRICVGSDDSEVLTPIIVDVGGKAHNTVQSPDGREVAENSACECTSPEHTCR